MPANDLPRWLEWAREIQALAQTSTTYAENHFQRRRYQRLTEIAAEIVAEHAGLPAAQLAQIYGAQTGYATPRVDVRAAVFDPQGRLLLVRERSDNGWTLPGGWADVGDVPSQAAEREAWEETGFHVRARKLVGVYDANRIHGNLELFHAYKLVFLCDILDGAAAASDETSEVRFFAVDELPQVFSAARTEPRHVADAVAAYGDAQRPAVYD